MEFNAARCLQKYQKSCRSKDRLKAMGKHYLFPPPRTKGEEEEMMLPRTRNHCVLELLMLELLLFYNKPRADTHTEATGDWLPSVAYRFHYHSQSQSSMSAGYTVLPQLLELPCLSRQGVPVESGNQKMASPCISWSLISLPQMTGIFYPFGYSVPFSLFCHI